MKLEVAKILVKYSDVPIDMDADYWSRGYNPNTVAITFAMYDRLLEVIACIMLLANPEELKLVANALKTGLTKDHCGYGVVYY